MYVVVENGTGKYTALGFFSHFIASSVNKSLLSFYRNTNACSLHIQNNPWQTTSASAGPPHFPVLSSFLALCIVMQGWLLTTAEPYKGSLKVKCLPSTQTSCPLHVASRQGSVDSLSRPKIQHAGQSHKLEVWVSQGSEIESGFRTS